ncbi:MAG: hypothetical protein U9N61_03910, partial [Euryarchaeota archaeon]|nr:hypothetical protein [Euryarchaeota archaeon]
IKFTYPYMSMRRHTFENRYDEGLQPRCGLYLLEFQGYRGARIALVGFQPVHARRCSERGELKLDLDVENVGWEKFGVVVLDGVKDVEEVLRWCDSSACYGDDGC